MQAIMTRPVMIRLRSYSQLLCPQLSCSSRLWVLYFFSMCVKTAEPMRADAVQLLLWGI